MDTTQPPLCFPLFGGPPRLTPEQLKAQQQLVRHHSNNPGLRALFNLIERQAFRLQGEGILPDATAHEQGQAYGATYIYGIARTWLEGTEEEEEDQD
jgi:hypothetical protein